jgi:hypothetical protein
MDNETFGRLRRLTQNRQIEDAQRFLEQSRIRLGKIIERKLTTTFIGDLARIELYFGALWGHGKTDSQRSEAERAWFARYEQLRQDILDNGNKQARALRAELTQYDVKWNRVETRLTPLNGNV